MNDKSLSALKDRLYMDFYLGHKMTRPAAERHELIVSLARQSGMDEKDIGPFAAQTNLHFSKMSASRFPEGNAFSNDRSDLHL